MRAFQNPAEECRLMEALQYQVRVTSDLIRSHLHRSWMKEQEQRLDDPLRQCVIRIQSHIATPLEAPIAPIPRAFKQWEKLDMKKETIPGGRFFCHASVFRRPETRKINQFVNLTLIAAATELLEMAEKEADLTSEAPAQPSYLTFGKRCWSGMPEGEPEYGEWRVRIRRPLQQSTAFKSMAVALRGSCTTDQAVDCGSRHVNCCVCASCRRWTLCPTECRMCGFCLEMMVGRFKDDDEVLTETMAEIHDRLYYQITYLQGAPGGALCMYPYQRNPNDIADRLPTRIRWKNLVLSVNDVAYFNSTFECEQCGGTHNFLRPKGKPMPFLMGSASYKEMSNSDPPPEFDSVFVKTCPDPDEKEKPIEHHIRDADEFRGRPSGSAPPRKPDHESPEKPRSHDQSTSTKWCGRGYQRTSAPGPAGHSTSRKPSSTCSSLHPSSLWEDRATQQGSSTPRIQSARSRWRRPTSSTPGTAAPSASDGEETFSRPFTTPSTTTSEERRAAKLLIIPILPRTV